MLGVGRRELRRCLCICVKEFNMERSAQFRDGERVDSSTGTAERLDVVKRGRSRCRRAETTAARRAAKYERERRRRSCETVEQTAARRPTDRSRSNRRRSAETPQQTEAQRAADRCCSRRRRSCVHHFGQLSCRATISRLWLVCEYNVKSNKQILS